MKGIKLILINIFVCLIAAPTALCAETEQQDALLPKIEAIVKQQLEQVLSDQLRRLADTFQTRIAQSEKELGARMNILEDLSRALIGIIPAAEKQTALAKVIEKKDWASMRSLRAAGLLRELKDQPIVGRQKELPLVYAARNDLKELTKALLDAKANVHFTDNKKRTLLHFAAENNATQVMPLLIKAKVNINAQDVNDSTPLHIAALNNNTQLVKILLEGHPKVDVFDVKGRTPLYIAVLHSDYEVARLLIDANANVNHQLGENLPMIHVAAKDKATDLARLLIKAGANVLVRSPEYGESVIHYSSVTGNLELTRILLESGADINSQAEGGETPLHAAADWGQEDVVKFLLAAGADKSLKDKEGKTPRDWAIRAEKNQLLIDML